jgi:hypothetical protein
LGDTCISVNNPTTPSEDGNTNCNWDPPSKLTIDHSMKELPADMMINLFKIAMIVKVTTRDASELFMQLWIKLGKCPTNFTLATIVGKIKDDFRILVALSGNDGICVSLKAARLLVRAKEK